MKPARRVRVEARAKVNLGLAVGPRRPDGYHEIATVFQSISLADSLEVRRAGSGFRLRVRFEEVARSSRRRARAFLGGRDNLVLRAARLLRRRLGFRDGASFHLVKRIPIGAGLGGGSADAAAALVGLARLVGLRLTPGQRLALAAELGSDVPFAAMGGTAVGRGRGERLRKVRLAKPFRAIVATPAWRISTAKAYREIDRGKYALTAWRAKLRFAQSLERDEVTATRCLRLGNTFEKVLRERQKDFHSLSRRMEQAGLLCPTLTGSGSAMFGILRAGVPADAVIGRFDGTERLYAVSSARSSLRVRAS